MLLAGIADTPIEFFGFDAGELALDKFKISNFGKGAFRIVLNKLTSPGFANHYGVGYFCENNHLFIDQRNGTYALIDRGKTQVVIGFPEGRQESVSDITAVMLSICLLKFEVLMAHASLVDLDGVGVLFIGNSGVGKTTQAEQWQKHRSADIINGDHVFIRKWKDCFWGYGSPWHGSSPYCENKKTKLRAIVALRQSAKNRLTHLSGLDAILEVENGIYLPKWRREEMDQALPVFDDLLSQVPVYLLECRIDEEAVEIVYNEVFRTG
jgi:hypothetical protein